jgi:hypothetical protein
MGRSDKHNRMTHPDADRSGVEKLGVQRCKVVAHKVEQRYLLLNSDVGRFACGLEGEPTFSREPVAGPKPLGTNWYTGYGLLEETAA